MHIPTNGACADAKIITDFAIGFSALLGQVFQKLVPRFNRILVRFEEQLGDAVIIRTK